MGAALAALLRRELESVVESDLASDATLLEQRSQELDEREAQLADRERRLSEREARLTAWEERLSAVEQRQRAAAVSAGRKVGRNEPCPCGSGRKYKVCHGSK
jgi:preprotein translocase subunit SecA